MNEETLVLIQVIGDFSVLGATAFDGQYVVEADVARDGVDPLTGRKMVMHLVTTPDPEQATRFTSAQALDLWRSVDPRRPQRTDGRPNRPFTAFSIALVNAGDVA